MKSRSRLFAISVAVACLATGVIASVAQAASPAWLPIASSGPTNLPPTQSEVQRVAVDATGGAYTLTRTKATGSGTLSGASYFGKLTSGSNLVTPHEGFAVNVISGALAVGQEVVGPGIPPETDIAGLFAFGPIVLNATLSKNAEQTISKAPLNSGLKEVTGVSVASGAFSVGDGLSGTGIPTGTTITTCSPTCTTPTSLTISALPTTSGSQALSGTQTTAPIDFDAGGPEVAAALNALPGLEVTVTGGPGGKGANNPYFVTFGGSLADLDVPQMSADGGGLSGGDNHTASVSTALNGGPGTSMIMAYAQNIGGAPSFGSTTLEFTLPPGVTTTATPAATGPNGTSPFVCGVAGTAGPDRSSGKCETSEAVQPGFTQFPVKIPVKAAPGAESGVVHITVSGGGTVGSEEYDMPLVVSAIPSPPGFQSFNAGNFDDSGAPDTRAGGHPYSASAGILVNTVRAPSGAVTPAGEFRDILVDTPPGFVGNPIAPAQCPEAVDQADCEFASVVATAQIPLSSFTPIGNLEEQEKSAVNNIEAPYGFPAKFRFITGTGQVIINVAASLRSDEDYGLKVGSYNTSQIKPVYGAFFTIWGTPADSGHDGQRCKGFDNRGFPSGGCGPGGDNVAFLTNPVDCAEEVLRPPVATLNVNTWQDTGLLFAGNVPIKPVTHCDQLHFDADFTFEPSNTVADSPASFKTSLTVPSEGLTDPSKLTTPEIKDTVVTLPEGVVLNASGADGLQACSMQQVGLKGTNFPMPNPIRFDKAPNTCPEASKIGTGELKTALLTDPLKGALYLAAQGDGNPFGSLFAIYLVIEDPRHGIFIKLPGRVDPDEKTGQMKVTFTNLPQLPFTRLDLSLKGGNRSALASPTTCGRYVTTATNTPWSAPESGPPTASANGFEINQGPNGMPCAQTPQQRPFDIGWSAGADSTTAGASGPFNFRITRPDGSQELDTLELSTPRGVSASLKGIPSCSDAQIAAVEQSTGRAEQANPACPAASQVGSAITAAGSGPTPYFTGGKLYLAGPYKGAPISVLAVTPAVAGPFDLGNVVVRSAVFINRSTAQVTAKTDPIPQILKGVALRIRDVRIRLDRKDWTINPTSCDASSVNLKATGNSGAVVERTARFQVGGCGALNFKPRFKAKLTGGTKRAEHPAFTAELNYPPGPGYANIKDFQVTLPHSEFLEQSHINTICTRVQAAANRCPQGSIYGYAEATTPLVDAPLTGPVFLKSSDHKLPDLAIALKGPASQPVEVEFAGRIDSINGQIRNTIEGLPDVPVTKFVLKMKGGNKGLLVNSRNLCAGKATKMTVKMTGQNNKLAESRPPLTRSCKGKKPRKGKKGKRQGRARSSGLVGGR